MNNTTQEANSPLNPVLWVLAVALIVAGIYGNTYFGGESLLYRVLGMLAVAIVAAMVALQTTQGKAFWLLLKGARTEIRKVVWPTRQETVQTTMIVSLVVIVAGLLLWGLDTLLGWLVSLVIG
ncbi:preprotein translocase subunit SecE [Pseudomonadales bacterium]|jgi:preprotein translocase subunit SecE|nr:preprotein translocase subunit SecE [Pseudomonadales bacterium]MDG1938825.1 preprotein translocase subunit SecE [Pseudomonadales bacterium]